MLRGPQSPCTRVSYPVPGNPPPAASQGSRADDSHLPGWPSAVPTQRVCPEGVVEAVLPTSPGLWAPSSLPLPLHTQNPALHTTLPGRATLFHPLRSPPTSPELRQGRQLLGFLPGNQAGVGSTLDGRSTPPPSRGRSQLSSPPASFTLCCGPGRGVPLPSAWVQAGNQGREGAALECGCVSVLSGMGGRGCMGGWGGGGVWGGGGWAGVYRGEWLVPQVS